MHPRSRTLLAVVCVIGAAGAAAARSEYPDGRELMGRLLELARSDRAQIEEIGRSAGGQKLRLLEIAPPAGAAEPAAVLVVGNPEGTSPLASLAAVALAERLLAGVTGPAASVHWYILPVADPDGLNRWFARPRSADGRNLAPVDDDHDGAEGEDPPDDLDGDGVITTMLVEDPRGTWLIDPMAGVAREARAAHGERGRYRREIEGKDDDGDGLANEDAPGGVVPGRNFPHRFAPWTAGGGRWAADQPESRALLAFAFAHPEIAEVIVLGARDNLRSVPVPDPAPPSGSEPVKLPRRVASALGLDPGTPVPLDFVLATAREARVPDYPPERVRGLLDLGPREHPDPADLVWWRAASQAYRQALASAGLDGAPLAPRPMPGGTVAEWAYYQFGVVSFAVEPWSCPAADSAAVARVDTAVATAAVRDDLALEQFAASHGGHGWRPWHEVVLPDGRHAQVGGAEPGARHTPPPQLADSLLAGLVPAWLDLARWRPTLGEVTLAASPLTRGTWEVTATIPNTGPVPYPTAQGAVCLRPSPVVVTLGGAEVLDGTARRVVRSLPAGGATQVRWVVRGDGGAKVTVTVAAPSLGEVSGATKLGGGAR